MEDLFRDTLRVIEALYERGFRRFICGGATGFDTVAASCVLIQRERLPDLRLILALPCGDQDARWTDGEKSLYRGIRERADQVVVLAERYYNGCMMARNRFMADHASYCVAYWNGSPSGGTASTVGIAVRKGIPVLNLAVADEVRLFIRDTAERVPLPF